MTDDITYGSIIRLHSGTAAAATGDSGGYLSLCGDLRGRKGLSWIPDDHMVFAHPRPGGRHGASDLWRIVSAKEKKEGDAVAVGDPVHLQSLLPGGGYLDTCEWVMYIPEYKPFQSTAAIGVFTDKSANRDHGSGTWIVRSDERAGTPVHAGDRIHLTNAFPGAGTLVPYGDVEKHPTFADLGLDDHSSFALTSAVPTVIKDHGWWTVSLATERYDLKDAAVRKTIRGYLDTLKLDTTNLAAVTSTPAKTTKTLTVGFIFVGFAGESASPEAITAAFDRLTTHDEQRTVDGTTTTVKRSFTDWYADESHGRCAITTRIHPKNRDSTGKDLGRLLVTQWEGKTALADDGTRTIGQEALQQLVDEAGGTVPADWDITAIVLPETKSTKVRLDRSEERDCTWSTGAKETVFIGTDLVGDWEVLTHETLHALGLSDLYTDKQRYMAWSLMSCALGARHILGWEKLVLGWLDLEDYVWLKRGIDTADLHEQSAAAGTVKGIVVVDEKENAAYVTERAQAIGVSPRAYAGWSDHGLLRYRVTLGKADPQIVPFVAQWDQGRPGAVNALRAVYRPPAVSAADEQPDLGDGFFLEYGALVGATPNSTISTVTGRIEGWQAPRRAAVLKSGQYIEARSGHRARLTLLGALEVLDPEGKVVKTFGIDEAFTAAKSNTEYGYFAEVVVDTPTGSPEGTTPAMLLRIWQGDGPTNKGLLAREVVGTMKTLPDVTTGLTLGFHELPANGPDVKVVLCPFQESSSGGDPTPIIQPWWKNF